MVGIPIFVLILQCLIVASLFLLLFRLRAVFGLSLIYTALGVLQFLQVFLSNSFFIKIIPGIFVSPGTVVLFPASLFVILLIYIREDAIEARKIIYALVFANLVLSLIQVSLSWDGLNETIINSYQLPESFFLKQAQIVFFGSIILLLDTFLLIFLYEGISRYIPFLFLRILLTTTLVLAIDTSFFTLSIFGDTNLFKSILFSSLLSKTSAAFVYSVLFTIYLNFIEKIKIREESEANSYKDIFNKLTYRQKFEHITKEKESKERDLKKTTFELNQYFDNALDLFCITNFKGEFLKLNKEWENTLGYKLEELIGTPFINLVHPDDIPATLDAFSKLKQNQEIKNFTNRYRSKNGDYRIIEWRSKPQAKMIFAAARDITESKNSEKNLLLANSIVNKSQAVAFLWRNEEGWPVEFVSNNVKRVLGYSAQEFTTGKVLFSRLIYKNDLNRVTKEVEINSKNPNSKSFNHEPYRVVTKSGKIIWLDDNTQIIRDNTGKIMHYEGVIYDITETKQHEEEIRKLSLAVHQSTSVIIITDIKGKIEYVNRKFTEITGYKENEVIGKNPSILKSGETTNEEYKQLWDNIKSGKVWKGEFKNKKKNGDFIFESASIFPLFNQNNEIINFVAINEDITKRKKLEIELAQYRNNLENSVKERTLELEIKTNELKRVQLGLMNLVDDLNLKTLELEKANIQLQELDKLKSIFLASMSHELRTPLNSIIGYTGILLMGMTGELNEEQIKQLKKVKNNGRHLLDLINDILDISKIEANKVELKIEKINIKILVEQTLEVLLPLIQKKKLKVIMDIPEHMEIETDERRIKQVLMNLVSNAVKFTNSGSITVNSILKDVDKIEIKVSDTGIGLTPEGVEKLFQPFQQIDSDYTKHYEGTGLGLYLCRKLMTLLGGTIAVTSAKNVGSEFTIELPLKIET